MTVKAYINTFEKTGDTVYDIPYLVAFEDEVDEFKSNIIRDIGNGNTNQLLVKYISLFQTIREHLTNIISMDMYVLIYGPDQVFKLTNGDTEREVYNKSPIQPIRYYFWVDIELESMRDINRLKLSVPELFDIIKFDSDTLPDLDVSNAEKIYINFLNGEVYAD